MIYKIYKKKLFFSFFITFLTLTGCGASKENQKPVHPAVKNTYSPPKWYKDQNLSVKPFEIIGYGEGVTKEQAANQARSEIAKTIQVKVESISKERSTFEKKKGIVLKDRFSISEEISTSSKIQLDDIKPVKSEVAQGKVYVSLKYINLPVPEKVKYTLDRLGGYDCSRKNKSYYLSNTPLMKRLKQVIGCEPEVTVLRRNSVWYLSVGTILTGLALDDFSALWNGRQNDSLILKSTKASLQKGDFFHLSIEPKTNGYLSLFMVYNTGKTTSLLTNKEVKGKSPFTWPDLKKYDGMVADIPDGQKSSKDLYLALLCPQSKDFTRYEPITTDLASEESYLFGNLLRDMEGCIVSGQIIHVLSR